jgi:hypothetical protein
MGREKDWVDGLVPVSLVPGGVDSDDPVLSRLAAVRGIMTHGMLSVGAVLAYKDERKAERKASLAEDCPHCRAGGRKVMPVKTNTLKKGQRVRLRNGWWATLEDNLRGNTRMATVEGLYTEMGSIYSHDIEVALIEGTEVPIELTAGQIKCREWVDSLGF